MGRKHLWALLVFLALFQVSWATIDNCKSEYSVDSFESCYTVPSSQGCTKDCANGYVQTAVTSCGVCSCETCCIKRTTAYCSACKTGFTLSTDKKSCSDNNECLLNTPVCLNGTSCTNTVGSFVCGTCPAGTSGAGQTGCYTCPTGKYGVGCAGTCSCGTGLCSVVDGTCDCTGTGFSGASCSLPICGDGRIVGSEQCDDGNNRTGDCCSSSCQFEGLGASCASDNNNCTSDICDGQGSCTHINNNNTCYCGNKVVDPGEQCDEGANSNLNCLYGLISCNLCKDCFLQAGIVTYCGDSVITLGAGEECDDGNSRGGDGCSSTCKLEIGFVCSTPGVNCTKCPAGTYGYRCGQQCDCQNGGDCNNKNGACTCVTPWIGSSCNILPAPTSSSVGATAIRLIVNSDNWVTLPQAIISPITRFALISGGSCSSNRLFSTAYNQTNTQLEGTITAAGSYQLCLSYDAGSSYALQTLVTVTAFPPAATPTSITSFQPTDLYTSTLAALFLAGHVPSSTTFIAFSLSTTCSSPVGITSLPAGTGNTIVMESAIGSIGTYYLCYSTNSSYVRQTVANVTVQNQSPSAILIKTITPSQMTVGQTSSTPLNLTDSSNSVIPPDSSKFIFFVPNYLQTPNCGSPPGLGFSAYNGTTGTISGSFPLAGTYSICYSTQGSSGPWTLQILNSIQLTVVPPAANATSISAISPSTILIFTTPSITFTGAIPSSQTLIAFVPQGTSCTSSDNRVAVTRLSSTSGLSNATLSGQLSKTGNFQLCYSTDGGSNYVLQTASLTVLAVNPTPATPTTITGLSIDSFDTTQSPSINFTGPILSATTYVGVISSTQSCSNAKLSAGSISGPNDFLISSPILLNSSLTATISNPGFTAGTYYLCYSVDNGVTWVGQTLVNLEVVAPAATNTSISGVSPSDIVVKTNVSLTFTGAVPSKKTLVALVFASSFGCNESFVVTQITQAGAVYLSSTLPSTGSYRICYSTDAGQTWFRQINPTINGLPPPATPTTVSSISPELLDVDALAVFSLNGATPSSTTIFAFVAGSPSNCASGSLLSITSYPSSAVNISSSFSEAKAYYLCYSTDSGTTWVGQTNSSVLLTVKAPDARKDSIQAISSVSFRRDSSSFIVGQIYNIEAIGAVPSSRSLIKFTLSSGCEGGVEIIYTQVGMPMSAALSTAGVYYICYSTDNRGKWVTQDLRLFVRPSPAYPTSISAVDPVEVIVKSPNSFVFSGAIPSNETLVTFVLAGVNCSGSGFNLTSFTLTVSNTFLQATSYELCYSTDAGTTWVKQTLVSFQAIPPAPKANSITSIVLQTGGISLYAGQSGINATIAGGVPSSRSRIAFVPLYLGVCNKVNLIFEVTYSQSVVSLGLFTKSGFHFACYSTDNGQSYVRQNGGFLNVSPPPATPTSVTSVNPKNVTAFSNFQLQLEGVVYSSWTYLAFVKKGQACPEDPEYVPVYNADNILISSFLTTGTYSLCLAVVNYEFVKQINEESEIVVYAPAATSHSIVVISPPTLYESDSNTTPIIFVGSVPSLTTYGALSTGDCNPQNFVATLYFNISNPILEKPLAAGSYKICYSTTLGDWVLQLNATGFPLSFEIEVDPSGPTASPGDNKQTILIGSIVGGVLAFLALLAIVIGVYWHLKTKRLRKFENLQMEVPNPNAGLSDNPVFEESHMYEARVHDHFAGKK